MLRRVLNTLSFPGVTHAGGLDHVWSRMLARKHMGVIDACGEAEWRKEAKAAAVAARERYDTLRRHDVWDPEPPAVVGRVVPDPLPSPPPVLKRAKRDGRP